MNAGILTSLIAAGSASGGIVVKIGYDWLTDRAKQRTARSDRYIDERKAAYDEFWVQLKALKSYDGRLQELSLIARSQAQVKPEVLAEFPDSPMPALVSALETIRKLARTHRIVQVCESIVALGGDAAAALRIFLTDPSSSYGLPYFLVQRFLEDREREFIAAYREDLGIGLPNGAPKTYPTVARPWAPGDAEGHLRWHLKMAKKSAREAVDSGSKPTTLELTEEDRKLLESPRIKSQLILPEGSEA